MTVTRTQAGKTPRKTEHPGFVETPGLKGRRKSRKSNIGGMTDEEEAQDSATGMEDSEGVVETVKRRKKPAKAESEEKEGKQNGFAHANGHANGRATETSSAPKAQAEQSAASADDEAIIDFGGSPGVTAIMIGFPLLMYYMWIGATYYDGNLPWPTAHESWPGFFSNLGHRIYYGAYPSLKAWIMYWSFLLFEAACYCLMPGIWTKGKPLPHEGGKQLDYYCSAMWSWWTTIILAVGLHLSDIFKLYEIIDEFGPIMSVAIISSIAMSFVAYASAIYRGKQHRMTGYPIYDFFMGAELNPRMFGILDFKMFFEVRLPWYILFLLSLGTAARQYERYGYVSGEVGFLVLAHWLYANACSKGEELIVPTWDMYYEKWGFMLIFWNLAGVPLSYCHCTLYFANHDPSTYPWNKYALAGLYVAYLFVYWVWDTTNSQKNRFRAEESGNTNLKRKAFPQLPWQSVKNPKVIRTKDGCSILADGWYGYARKIHYTCDLFFAVSWAAVTGFRSPFPWFYPVFFGAMITHRAWRDVQKCRKKYGEAWLEYERQVPYLFIPYVF